MQKFRLLINGVNFHLRDLDADAIRVMGFYINAFVEAESPEAAESTAIDIIRVSPKLKDVVLNPRDDPPQMFVEEIHHIDNWPANTSRPLTGFGFYHSEDGSSHDTQSSRA